MHSWVFSYICLLIIAITINYTLVYNMKDVIENEIIKENQFMVSTLKDDIDRVYQDMSNLISSLTENRSISNLALSSVEKFEDNYHLTSNIMLDLQNLQSNMTFFPMCICILNRQI